MRFDRKTIWVAVSLFAVLILSVTNWAATAKPAWPTEWHELVTCDASGKPFMIFQFVGELPPLETAALSGKAKFITFGLPTWAECRIGYVIDLTTLPIPKDEVPEKYKKETTFDTPSGPLRIPPLDEANYEIVFQFRLMDADGFEIATVNSPKHYVLSGQTKRIQSQTEPTVTMAQANRLDKITVEMSVHRCMDEVE